LALIIVAIFGLPWINREKMPDLEVIPIELIEAVEEQAKAPEPEKKPEPETKPEPEPEPEPEPTPKPEPKPEPESVAATPATRPEPPSPPEPEAVPSPTAPPVSPLRKPKPPSRFDANKLAALIDKKIEDEPAPKKAETSKLDVSKILEKTSRSALEQARLVADLRGAIRSQVEPCWSVPAGARYAEELTVRIRIYLHPNGALARAPEIMDSHKLSGPDGDFFRVASESARRAVQRCAPLDLPRETYDLWRDIELTFDPSKMLGG
jgi:outer membrane biosynthesis protein TonB